MASLAVNMSPLSQGVECDAKWMAKQNLSIETSSFSERLAKMQLIDEAHWEEHKEDIAVLIPGKFDGTYKSFDEIRKRLVSLNTVHHETLYNRQVLMLTTPPELINAWKECVLAQIHNPQITCWIDQPTNDGATLNVNWRTGYGLGVLRNIDIDLGSNGVMDHPGDALLDGLDGDYAVIIRRKDPTKEVRGTIRGTAGISGDFAAGFLWPVLPPPPQITPLADRPISVGDHGADLDFRLEPSPSPRVVDVTLTAASTFQEPGSHVQRLWFWGPGVEHDSKEQMVWAEPDRVYISHTERFLVMPNEELFVRGHLYNNGAMSRGMQFSGRVIT